MADARRRILVVDDAEDNVDLLKRRLERRGYSVLCAMSGSEALDLLDREPIDLVLLDVMMPGMSGVEVLQVLRRKRARDDLPVIMATANSGSADVVEALDKGANDYIVKPIDLEVLLARMRVHLGTPPTLTPPTDDPQMYVAVGSVLDRKYRLEAVIGSGGFGTVYRATHLALAKDVAVKILHGHLIESEQAIRRFEHEGISACRVQHPNAVAVLDAGTTARGVPYLVMELLCGSSLAEELKAEGALPLARAAALSIPVCEALAEAHRQGIVHRDVTPANILLSRGRDGAEVVKVLDFGIAKFVNKDSHTDPSNEVTGTPDYMAPERLLGDPSDARADIYSVGVMIYQMLAAQLPFPRVPGGFVRQAMAQLSGGATSLLVVRPDLPPALAQVVMAALSHSPAERPGLAELQRTLGLAAEEWSEPEWPPPSLRRLVPHGDYQVASADEATRVGGYVSDAVTIVKPLESGAGTGPRVRAGAEPDDDDVEAGSGQNGG